MQKNFHPFKVEKIEPISHNTRLYTVKVPGQGKLPVSSFVLTRTDVDGKETVRPYTPITSVADGQLRFMIKSYPEGKVSKYFGGLKEGDNVELKGPVAKLEYKPNMKKEIGMLAGGTGITPMLQVLEEVLGNPKDQTKVTLLFANHTEGDILLKSHLDKMASSHPSRFKVVYVVSKPSDAWKGVKGRINKDLIHSNFPKPSDQTLVYVCGPTEFYKALSGPKAPDYSQGDLSGALAELGYTKDQVFKF